MPPLFVIRVPGKFLTHLIPSALGTGYLPFWLDETHYGFFRANETLEAAEIWVGTVDGDDPRLQLTSQDVFPLLENTSINSFLLAWMMARPHSPTPTAVLLAIGQEDGEQFAPLLLTWDENWETIQDIQVIQDIGEARFPFFSPDGNYLVLLGTPLPTSQLVLIDLTTGAGQRYRFDDLVTFPYWSGDGQWLVQLTNNEILLIAPSAQFSRRIPHTFSYCNRYFYVPEPE